MTDRHPDAPTAADRDRSPADHDGANARDTSDSAAQATPALPTGGGANTDAAARVTEAATPPAGSVPRLTRRNETTDDDEIVVQKGLFPWFFTRYLRKHLPLIIFAGLLMSVEGSMLGFLSYMMKPMFDTVFIEGKSGALYGVGFAILLIFVVRATTSVIQKVLLTRVSSIVIMRIQNDLLRHLMTLDTEFHQVNPPGALMERVRGETGAIGSVANALVTGVGRDAISLISLFSVVLYIDWQWTLVALIGTPLLVLPTFLVQRFIRKTAYKRRILAGKMSTRLDEIFHGINPVKLNALETYQARRFKRLSQDSVKISQQAMLGKSLIPGLIDIMTGVGFFGVLIFGGSEIIAGEKTVGEFMSFFTAMALAFEPLRRLGGLSGTWQQTAVSLHRIKSLFDIKPSLTSPEEPVDLPEAHGDIRLDDVRMNYGELPVLRGCSFTAEAGKTTALVGASGAGKSTVFNLLTRLIDPDDGVISIGGIDTRSFSLGDLRGQFSIVSQDAALFDESLRDNILLGRSKVSEEELDRVLRAAHIADFIDSLPNGIDSPAGPRGSNLSGGQRQRVAIARALLRNRPILLLDEATSALDVQSEAVVQQALDSLSAGRTTIVIAHRLSTIRNASKIVVMDAGVVVESGTHEELLARDGHYAKLYRLQFRKSEEATRGL